VALLRARFNGPRRYEEWITLLRECGKPLRRFAVFEEYRCPPRLGGIKFYCNRLTEVCQWEQPIGWIEEDKREYQVTSYISVEAGQFGTAANRIATRQLGFDVQPPVSMYRCLSFCLCTGSGVLLDVWLLAQAG
jgi:hypothetical protein